MSTGHHGIRNEMIDEGGSGGFRAVLSRLYQGNHVEYVIHVTSDSNYSQVALEPAQLFFELRLYEFKDGCPFMGDKCHYYVVANVQSLQENEVDMDKHHAMIKDLRQNFRKFADNIDKLYELRVQMDHIMRGIGRTFLDVPQFFGPTVYTEIAGTDEPIWVNEIKFPLLMNLEKESSTLQARIDELRAFLPLLYETGKGLEVAVISALEFLGLTATPTKKGFTADILAQTPDSVCRFGFEVTGLDGAIKKSSNKLTQVVDFERVKEHGEKTVLLASTHKSKPISERENLEDFTQQAIDFLSAFPILLMTGWDLYCMIGDVLEGSRTKDEIVELLYTTKGLLGYGKEHCK